MAKNTDTSIKLLVLYDILSKMTDEEHALSTNEIIDELAKRGITVSRKVLPSDIALLNKYGYEVCSYTKKARYYYAVHQFFDTAEITMLGGKSVQTYGIEKGSHYLQIVFHDRGI